jgi:hypothetical protein
MKFEPSLKVFSWRLVFKRLMGPDGVRGSVPGFKLLIMVLHAEGDILA